jgi:uncharacterized membrane-anchored protein
MKKFFLAVFVSSFLFTNAQDSSQVDVAAIVARMDSIENSFKFERGSITLKNGVGTLQVPAGFKYLEPVQAERVLTDLWGNPKDNSTLGLLLPENQKLLSDSGYVFNLEYDEIGFVKDDDADDINYDELLQQMQKESIEANAERKKLGYDPIAIVGWASSPFYDKERKILHWAKEIKFGDATVNTLNYNVRILGRKGVFILNAIATMPNLPTVKNDLPKVMDIVKFSDGNQYKDFNPDVDHVAAWTIGGLVAGKVLAKVGFFALILKFWKIIALAVAGFFGYVWKRIRGKKDDPANNTGTTLPS